MRIVTSHNDLSCSKVNVVLMVSDDEVPEEVTGTGLIFEDVFGFS